MRGKRFASGVLIGAGIVAAAVVAGDTLRDPGPATRIDSAAVLLDDSTARVVEQVEYRDDVERVGDLVIVDGRPATAAPVGDVAAMWALVDGIWPESLRGELRQLSVIDDEPRGLVGVVHPSAAGGWILSLDVADLEDPALIEETVVHELSHVLTLDPEVFTFAAAAEGPCDGVEIELGCARAGSTLAGFAQQFWPDGDRPVEEGGPARTGTYVNDYAASAAHEDLAETFTAWVHDWPTEPGIDAKIETLAAAPELAALRDELRAAGVAGSG